MSFPGPIKPPHDGRSAARPRGTHAPGSASGGGNTPGMAAATGAPGGFEAYTAHQFATMPKQGHVTSGDHRFVEDAMSAQDKAQALEKMRDTYAGMSDADRQHWESQANMSDVRSPREMAGGTLGSADGSASRFPGPANPLAGFGSTALDQPAQRVGGAGRGTHDTDAGGGLHSGSDTPFPGGGTNATTTSVRPGFYGMTPPGQESPASLAALGPQRDAQTVDASGNRHVSTVGGGTVDIPKSQPQDAPDDTFAASNGQRTGIYDANGAEQVKQPDGTFGAGTTSLAATAGQAPTTDPLTQAATGTSSGGTDAMTAGLLNGTAASTAANPTPPAGDTSPVSTASAAPVSSLLQTGSPNGGPDALSSSLLKPPSPTVQVNGAHAADKGMFPGPKSASAAPFDEEDEEQGSGMAFPGMRRNGVMT